MLSPVKDTKFVSDDDFSGLYRIAYPAIKPWLLSNIVDENTNKVPEHLELFKVVERAGVRIGIIGLIEEAWIATISAWPTSFKFKDMVKTGKELSQLLRGEDLILALTHCRAPNDLQLAKDLLALSPSAQEKQSIAREHGADIIIGGHDHFYFVSKGVTTWEGFDVSNSNVGADENNGDVLSGTDFKDLSEFTLELEDTPSGSVRKKVIKAVNGKRRHIEPAIPSSENMQKILKTVLSSVDDSLDASVCISEVDLGVRSPTIRTGESVAGNWISDVLKHAYGDALQTTYHSGADGVLITSRTLRGDTLYTAGDITLRNILEILPFDDPIIVLELDGESLWNALESGLYKYPSQGGRFPIISGFRVSWDSRRPSGQRILGIWHLKEALKSPLEGSDTVCDTVDGEVVTREKNGQKYLIDNEHGQLMTSLVRKYLIGAHSVNKMVRLRAENQDTDYRPSGTADVLEREINHRMRHGHHHHHPSPNAAHRWRRVVAEKLHRLRSRGHYLDHYNICAQEHMTEVGHYRFDKGGLVKVTNKRPARTTCL